LTIAWAEGLVTAVDLWAKTQLWNVLTVVSATPLQVSAPTSAAASPRVGTGAAGEGDYTCAKNVRISIDAKATAELQKLHGNRWHVQTARGLTMGCRVLLVASPVLVAGI
jgi:hypothetical protein